MEILIENGSVEKSERSDTEVYLGLESKHERRQDLEVSSYCLIDRDMVPVDIHTLFYKINNYIELPQPIDFECIRCSI